MSQYGMNANPTTYIIEGVMLADETWQIEDCQYLIYTDLAWHLQGSIDRAADRLIADGVCEAPR